MSATCTCCHDRSSHGICEINNAFICWCKEITKVLRKTRWFFMWPFPRSSWFLMKHNFLIHKIEKQVFAFQSSTKKHEFWLSCEFVMVKSLTKLWNFQLSLSFFSMIFFYDIWFFFVSGSQSLRCIIYACIIVVSRGSIFYVSFI